MGLVSEWYILLMQSRLQPHAESKHWRNPACSLLAAVSDITSVDANAVKGTQNQPSELELVGRCWTQSLQIRSFNQVLARERNYSSRGGYSAYINVFGSLPGTKVDTDVKNELPVRWNVLTLPVICSVFSQNATVTGLLLPALIWTVNCYLSWRNHGGSPSLFSSAIYYWLIFYWKWSH